MTRLYVFRIGAENIGAPEKTQYGRASRCFITLPKNEIYQDGYGFWVGGRNVNDDGTIYLIDGLKIELRMNPELAQGRRYKLFRMTAKDLRETILSPYEVDL